MIPLTGAFQVKEFYIHWISNPHCQGSVLWPSSLALGPCFKIHYWLLNEAPIQCASLAQMADFGGGVNSHSPHQARFPCSQSLKAGLTQTLRTQLLQKGCWPHGPHALTLPSCHTSALWRALTGLGCRELKAFPDSLYRQSLPTSQDFQCQLSDTFFAFLSLFREPAEGGLQVMFRSLALALLSTKSQKHM